MVVEPRGQTQVGVPRNIAPSFKWLCFVNLAMDYDLEFICFLVGLKRQPTNGSIGLRSAVCTAGRYGVALLGFEPQWRHSWE